MTEPFPVIRGSTVAGRRISRFPSTRRWSLPGAHRVAVGGFAAVTAMVLGAAIARDAPVGVAVALALLYVPLVMVDLPAGFAVWTALLFLDGLAVLSVAPTMAGILIVMGWLGTSRARRIGLAGVIRRNRVVVLALAGLVLWSALAIAWAREPGPAAETAAFWVLTALLFTIVATLVTSARALRLVIAAFVGGAVVAVTIGLLAGEWTSSLESATSTEGRLQGGSKDPNFLASGLVAAIALAIGLVAISRNAFKRAVLAAGVIVMVVGIGATQSRGAFVAAAAAFLAALVVYRRGRTTIIAVGTVIAAVAALWFFTYPAAWERLTSAGDGGSGRTDLWQVGWRMADDHPVLGVGGGNFRERAPEYVREPGSLDYVDLVVDRPHVAHNAYLQVLAEYGIVGLGMFLLAITGSLGAAWRAARLFDRVRERDLALLSRAVIVAQVGMLAAGFFISYEQDRRLWILLAFGPALLATAHRSGRLRTGGVLGRRAAGPPAASGTSA